MHTRRRGAALMVQGTASHAGKSTLVTALCRIAARAGIHVAPFKSQNMSLNAAVTPDGGEIGRAQYTQAQASGVVPSVRMNPILLKPTDGHRSQVIVLGRAIGVEAAAAYFARRDALWPTVTESLDSLRAEVDLVIMEGAGSPAEINLADREIVNMRVARYADAPIVLVGDIERGGVFASLYGTVMLVPPEERALIRGFVINKFRGDPALVAPGPAMLETLTGIPTFGVLPFFDGITLPEEDSLGIASDTQGIIDIAVVHVPHMANFDDFDPLRQERGVGVRFVEHLDHLGHPDLIILPGTKSTVADLAWLRARGFADAICRGPTPVLGICGGLQMLGTEILDPAHTESSTDCTPGLGLLNISTTFQATKTTNVSRETLYASEGLFALANGMSASGYEIHHGVSDEHSRAIIATTGRVSGTYIHGIFDQPGVRRAVLAQLARWKGVALALGPLPPTRDQAFDAIADHVCRHLDVTRVFDLVGIHV